MRIRPSTLLVAAIRHTRRALARMQRAEPGGATSFTAPAAPLDETTLGRYERRLAGLSPRQERDLDPTTHPGDFRQPNDVSCGAASLVFSRMVHDPPFAMGVVLGYDPRRDRVEAGTVADRWTAEVLAMHRRVTRWRDHDGDLQFPWLRIAGTSPWGAARQMEGIGGSGVPQAHYAARTLDPQDPDDEFERIATAVEAGHTVPLYVGNEVRPAHVVLVIAADARSLRAYEPSAGRIVSVTRAAFAAGTLRLGGWDVPWFAILPA